MKNENGQHLSLTPTLLAKLDFAIDPVFSLDLSPDGWRLASAGYDQIKIWDAVTQAETINFQAHDGAIWGVAWSPDGPCLAFASMDGTVKLWNPLNWQNIGVFETGLTMCAAWSPDGKMLASTGLDADIRVWRVDDGQLVAQWIPDALPKWSLVWSPDGRWLAVGNGVFGPEPSGAQVLIYKMA